MVAEPGEKWVYNTGITDLLTEIVRRATGSDFLSYGVKNIFRPLNITRYHWFTDAGGRYLGGSDLYLTTRDMAKLGYLYLNKGTWNGRVVLSPGWVSESVSPIYDTGTGSGYGYQWWSYPELGIYYASGRHEQNIYVVPKLDLVVAITADISDEHSRIYPVNIKLLMNYILPSCQDLTQERLTYSKDNVTINYPTGSYIIEADKGSLHRVLGFYSNEYFLLIYGGVPGSERELSMEEISLFFRQMFENVTDYSVGDYFTSNLGGHTVTLQPFNMTLSEVPIEGINSYWYCSETGRHFCLLYYKAEETLGSDSIMDGFRSYRDYITCH
jgi:hypothetical protein